MNERTNTNEGVRNHVQIHTNKHENQILNISFCDICSKNSCIEDMRRIHFHNSNLFLYHCKLNHPKSLIEVKDGNPQKNATQINIKI